MADLLVDVGTFLISKGAATADGVDLFRDFTPDTPDNVIIVSEYPGDPVDPLADCAHRSVQIKVRNISAEQAKAIATGLISDFVVETRKIQLSNLRWCLAYVRQMPFKMETDSANRVTYGFNIGITTTIE